MEQYPITQTDSLVSIQDQPRQQDDASSENVSGTDMTPTTIKTSHLSKEFKDILNLLDKRNRREGTCMLLKKCIQKQVIPKSFKSANTELYTDFCTSMKNRWNATTFLRIELSLEHHLKCLQNIDKKYLAAKTVFFSNLNTSEKQIFEKHFSKKISKSKKSFEKKHDEKLKHLGSVTIEVESQSQNEDETLLQETSDDEDVTVTLEETVADNDSNNDPVENADNESMTIPNTDGSNSQQSNSKSKSRTWYSKTKWKKMKKATLKQKINLVNNLSDLELTEAMKSLLNHGLNFCPNPEKVNLTQISADCFHLERNMAWKYVFPPGSNNSDPEYVKTPFDNTRKVNLPDYFPPEISTFTESVRSELIGAQHNKIYPNLTKPEKEALEELKHLQEIGDIVLQPADKNAGICVMNRTDYVKEAERQLTDTYVDADGVTKNYYQKVDPKEVDRQFAEVKSVLDEGLKENYISKKEYSVLLPPKPKASKLYLLPKIHKPYEGFPKCRPIVSGSGCNTERISWFCDNIVKEDVKKLDSYIEDTPDLLRKINVLNENESIPDGAKPIAIDIKSMYSNIPLQEGLDAFEEVLEAREDKTIPTEFVMKLVKLVMMKNIFTFNNQHWLQLLGTSMGSRVSPSWANLFYGVLEKKILQNCPQHLKQHIFLWKRFIDDMLVIFTGSWEQFEEFFEYLNSTHPTIKYDEPCYYSDTNSCNFLDLKISITENRIRTDLFRKHTDKPRALLPSSAHPNHIPNNIVYSMAFRLLRICDSEEKFNERLAELKHEFLIPRNYGSKLIDEQFTKVKTLPGENFNERRKLALEKKAKAQKSDRVIAPFGYNPVLPKLGAVLAKHHKTMLTDNPDLKKVFPQPPMASLRQGPNLRRLLCKATLPKLNRNPTRATHRTTNGWRRCSTTTGRQCPICPLTPVSAVSVTSHLTGYTHTIQAPLNCKSENVIYLWRCTKCGHNFTVNTKHNTVTQHNNINNQQGTTYCGMTRRKFAKRMAEHRDYAKSGKVEEPSGLHFNLPGHSFHHLEGLAVEQVRSRDPFILKARESWTIQKLDCFRNGQNKEP